MQDESNADPFVFVDGSASFGDLHVGAQILLAGMRRDMLGLVANRIAKY
jgi:hypothetical protein